MNADPGKLARVFSNLLRKAASYSYSQTEITISAKRLEHDIQIIFENKRVIFEIEKPLFGTMIIEQGLFIVQPKQNKASAYMAVNIQKLFQKAFQVLHKARKDVQDHVLT